MKVIDVRDTTLWKSLLPKLKTQDEEISLMLDLQNAADFLGEEFRADETTLTTAFTWGHSPQGFDFWRARYVELAQR